MRQLPTCAMAWAWASRRFCSANSRVRSSTLLSKPLCVVLDLDFGGGKFGTVLVQIAIGAHDVFESGHQKVDDLFLVGIDRKAAAEEHDLHAHAQFAASTQPAALEHGVHAFQKLVRLVGLGDEIVGAAFQPADDVHWVTERRQQHDRQTATIDAGLDALAKFVSRHSRHHDVGNHHIERRIDLRQRTFRVVGDDGVVSALFEHAAQPLGLRGAVLDDENPGHAETPSNRVDIASSRAIAPNGNTRSTNPPSKAALGIPKTAEVSRSCAIIVPPCS